MGLGVIINNLLTLGEWPPINHQVEDYVCSRNPLEKIKVVGLIGLKMSRLARLLVYSWQKESIEKVHLVF